VDKKLASQRAYLWQLIKEREAIVALLHVLDLDIGLRRKLEELRKSPFGERRSVDVERARESLQDDLDRLHGLIDAAIDLIAQRGPIDEPENEPE